MVRFSHVFPVFLVFFLACSSPAKLVETGNYDAAIDLALRKLSGKKKKKAKFVTALETAFDKATRQDMRMVQSLEKENRPEHWEKINGIHRQIKNRQQRIEPLLPLYDDKGRKATFAFVRIDELERESREKTAAYYYGKSLELLEEAKKGDKYAAREAYDFLRDLDQLYRDYKEKETLKDEARFYGASHILIRSVNASNQVLPAYFERELLQFSVGDLTSIWKKYYTDAQALESYDYTITIRITEVNVSPEMLKQREYTDEKEIEEGFDYVLDDNGNVKKDSLGNDIKVPKKVVIKAKVFESLQHKIAGVVGQVEYHDDRTNALLHRDQIAVDAVFEHYASTFMGDRRALSKDSKARIGNQPIPFPPNDALLLQAAALLKPAVKQKIANNQFIQ